MGGALVEQHVIDPDGKHLLGLLPELSGAFNLSPLDDGIAVGRRLVGMKMGFEKILVNAEFRSAQSESGFQAFRRGIERSLIQAFIINPFNLDDRANGSALGDKAPIVDEAENAALLGECAGLTVVLDEF